ncbi:MAG: hypothetical protein ACYSTL_07780, partial [Planctomycetota bacterium]
MKRLLLATMLFFELTVLSVAGIIVGTGDVSQGRTFYLILLAALAAVSLAAAFALPRKFAGRASTHGALLVGCVLFIFPFVWLVGTSFKYAEEVYVYPPKWIPSAPGSRVRSPYVTDNLFDNLIPPDGMSRERWKQLWPKVEEAFWAKAEPMLGAERLGQLEPDSVRPVVARGLWDTASPGVRPSVWEESDDAILATLLEPVDESRLEDVWRLAFRCVALRAPYITDIARREYALTELDPNAQDRWTAETDNIKLEKQPITLTPDQTEPVLATYDLTGLPTATVSGVFPLPENTTDLLSVTLPIHQDRTWNRLTVALEFNGKRYVNDNLQCLQMSLWQELTFKRKDLDDRDERAQGVWTLVEDKDAKGAFNEPDRFRIALDIHRSPALVKLWNKYFQNYRNAWAAGSMWEIYIFNTVYLVLLTVLGQIISCSLVAFAFARLRWPGRDWLFLILLGTMMLPAQVT